MHRGSIFVLLFLKALIPRNHISTAKTIYCSRHLTTPRNLIRMSTKEESPAEPIFDKAIFEKHIPLVCLKISVKHCAEFISEFKDHSWKRQKMKRIVDNPGDPSTKFFLLSEDVQDVTLSMLPGELQRFVRERNAEPMLYTLTLGYEHLGVEEVLKQILPLGIDIPSSFEQAGHIAHMNLRTEALPYKAIIGQVILDKNPTLRTVVNKMSNIASEFRTFPMELLAGEEDYLVTLKESGANFTFNFRNVYWNSRLQTEHQRVVDWIKTMNRKNAIVIADMMAGVGPFAVPIAMAGIQVYANDLNPSSFEFLEVNAKKNRCTEKLESFNKDGREFILELQQKQIKFNHVIMNLPQSAPEFLDVFVGYSRRLAKSDHPLPIIHVYAFSSAEDPVNDVANRCAEIMKCHVSNLGSRVLSTTSIGITGVSGPKEFELISKALFEEKAVVGHLVRDVAPKKLMVCLSFQLPAEVANSETIVCDDIESVVNKRRRL